MESAHRIASQYPCSNRNRMASIGPGQRLIMPGWKPLTPMWERLIRLDKNMKTKAMSEVGEVAGGEAYVRLAAVQVLVGEAKD